MRTKSSFTGVNVINLREQRDAGLVKRRVIVMKQQKPVTRRVLIYMRSAARFALFCETHRKAASASTERAVVVTTDNGTLVKGAAER